MRVPTIAVAFVALACASPPHAQGPAPQLAPLIGTWRLQSLVDTLPDGSAYRWLGENPSGEIRYDAAGRRAVQFMRDPRPESALGDVASAAPEELRAIVDGYYAYFGRYELNSRGDTVSHFVEASLRPDEVGIVYRRAVQVDGDALQISLEFISSADSLRHRRFLGFRRVR